MSTSSVAIFSSSAIASDGAGRLARLEDEIATARAALDGIAEGVVVVDAKNWRVRQINAPALVMLDLDGALPGIGFDAICRRLRTEDGSTPTPAALLLAPPEDGAYHYVRANGIEVPVALRATRARVAGRDLLVVALRDASARMRTASELGAASTRCGITFNQAAIGLAHVSLDGRWRRVNARLAAFVGYTEAELLAMTVQQTTHPDDSGNDAIAYRRLLDGEIPYTTREKRYVGKDGAPVWVSVNSSLARDADGTPQYFIAMVEDITERKRAERRIRYLATHDAMTGLPNRAGLQPHLDGALRAARASGLRVGVAFVDMDKLKQINDTGGHEAGDLALVDLARQLRAQVRGEDLVARIGGDEFVIVLSDVATRADIAAILDRVVRAPAAAACSIGVSVFPDDGEDARTLIRHADTAMYRAKHAGGAGYAFFHSTDIP
ncbi:diguanylate cyclase [Telluria mixta]|uniref:Diguanylate cyclase n=1 Tax=Telluria mixta TaxID=34071 RepID=A0ABT2BYX1_9BURK|nr:diguanylate cyclase [Telluria mixta]MCS0630330.1 diguanylate cyclase [Telluria mixta]WEM94361.1 diguanylate cyclase [Telluria mixta]